MALKISRRGQIAPFIVMDVMRAANAREAEGADVVHLEVGQPGTSAPAGVLDAARDALAGDRLGYTLAFGVPELRARIAEHYRARYGLDVPVARIVVTTGSSGGFLLAFLSAFDEGDRIALAEPGYPAYRNILTALGFEPVGVPTDEGTRFQPTPEILQKAAPDIDGLIIASPSNPTGTMIDPAGMAALVDYCRGQGIRLISDEIYHGLTYQTVETASAAGLTDDAFVINSFSKYFSMTGWRLGWMVVPMDLLRAVECLAQNLFISPPSLSQRAAVAAFDCYDELDANRDRYARNRELLLRELPKAGFDKLAPADGAFYIYADVRQLTNDSPEFCARMLAETGVATTPGVDFDPARGQAYIRISFAGTTEDMAEAAKRLIAWRGGRGD